MIFRETLICFSTYLCIHWLILVCALTRDRTSTLAYWAKAPTKALINWATQPEPCLFIFNAFHSLSILLILSSHFLLVLCMNLHISFFWLVATLFYLKVLKVFTLHPNWIPCNANSLMHQKFVALQTLQMWHFLACVGWHICHSLYWSL